MPLIEGGLIFMDFSSPRPPSPSSASLPTGGWGETPAEPPTRAAGFLSVGVPTTTPPGEGASPKIFVVLAFILPWPLLLSLPSSPPLPLPRLSPLLTESTPVLLTCLGGAHEEGTVDLAAVVPLTRFDIVGGGGGGGVGGIEALSPPPPLPSSSLHSTETAWPPST